uniref:Uncharacterized protein n=1 Tax=Anguilla anguilla TaxID=7936 RepID=A0A0E9ULP4_ANGAN
MPGLYLLLHLTISFLIIGIGRYPAKLQITAWRGSMPHTYTAQRVWHFSGFPTPTTTMTTDPQP